MLFTLSGVSKRPQNDNADPPSPQWAPSRMCPAVFKRTGASGHGIGTGNEDDSSVRTGNEDNGCVMTRCQDAGNEDNSRVTTLCQDT
jgi:hypothetical protein